MNGTHSDFDLDDVTPQDLAADNNNPPMSSSGGSVKTSSFSTQGKMFGEAPVHPGVAGLAGKLAGQTGHPQWGPEGHFGR